MREPKRDRYAPAQTLAHDAVEVRKRRAVFVRREPVGAHDGVHLLLSFGEDGGVEGHG